MNSVPFPANAARPMPFFSQVSESHGSVAFVAAMQGTRVPGGRIRIWWQQLPALPCLSLPGACLVPPWAWACVLPGVRALELCRLGGLLQEHVSIVSSSRTHVMDTVHARSCVYR